ncbi:MAG: glycosyltransferase family 39 protein [Syntrophales bacterium]|nr:glycosyltransferase family 39 protein [Syntrophales bacterium]MDP3098456.1 glycosyltransferase family 39 protein [Syntrophales bacterium]
MKTQARRFLDSRSFLVLTGLLYLALAGLLFYMIGARTKPEIEAILTKLIPKVLWANFLLIAVGVVLCWRDIAGAFRGLFAVRPRPLPVETGGTEEAGDHTLREAADPGGAAPRTETASRFARLNHPGVWLLLVFIVGLILASQVAPQIHRIYYDEDIYANMAQNMAFTGQAGMANYGSFEYGEYFVNWLGYNKDPSGWPFLISLAFQLFGTDETLAFYLNNLLFAGGILIVFFIVRLLAGGTFAGLIAALVFAIIPHNLIWSNTAAAETSAAFFAGLAVLCTLVYLKTRAPRHLFLLAAVLPFACYMRAESLLITLWASAAVSFNLFSNVSHPQPPFRHPFATRSFWVTGLIAFALIIPHFWHFFAISDQSWGASGAKFSTFFFPNNLTVNGFYFLNDKEFPVLFTFLALVGLAAWKGRPGGSGEKIGPGGVLLILLWFLLFWGIFLFFYAGSYKYGADVRFALVCFMPLAVLAGLGGDALREWVAGGEDAPKKEGETEAAAGGGRPGLRAGYRRPFAALLMLLLLFCWLKFVPLVRLVGQEAWGARHDHKYSYEFIRKIPNRAVVVTHIPSMFLLWGQNAIQAYAGINNPDLIRDLMNRYNGHVYFHKSYWCNTLNDANRSVCDEIGQRYDLEPVAVAREQSHEYGLYRMTPKK